MTYRVKDNHVIAYIEATDVSASICWIGIITEDDGCNRCETEQTYCETVYVGENTTTEVIPHTGTTTWHGITIWYTINQSGITIEPDCESATTTSCVTDSYNVWVSPYIVTKEEGGHDIKFYVDYLVETRDACNNVINVERVTSSGCPISDREGFSAETDFKNAIAAIECTDTDRTVTAACRLMDIVPCLTSDSAKTVSATCYVAEEEHCCDNSGTSVCYEIGDIVYTPTSVPFSGGDVYYSFDYKKKTTTNCVTTTQIGSYTSTTPWKVPSGATDDCKRHQVTYSLPISSITSNSGDTQCRTNASAITLSIWQDKNINNPSCQTSSCTESIGYCIDKLTIKQSAYTINDVYESSGTSASKLEFPSHGGKLKVVWEYSAITIYDDCSSAVTSGNTWEDVKTIDPYNGNDYFLSGDTRYDIIITAIKKLIQDYTTNETVANIRTEIESGKTVYYFTLGDNNYKIDYDEGFVKNTAEGSDEKYEIFNDSCGESGITVTLDYEFKTPSKVCESGNTFQIQYYQERPPCIQDCPSCISGGSITLECGYSAITEYNEVTSSTTIIGYDTSESGQTDLVPVTSETQCHVKSYSANTVPWWLSITINDDNIVYSANTRNSGSTSACSVVFVLDDVGGKECTETVTVMQIGSGAEQDPSSGPDELKCPCRNADGLYFGVYSLGTIPYKGGSDITFASYGFEECVPPSSFTYSISTSAATFYDNITTSATTYSATSETEGIFIGNISANCDCVEDRVLYLDYAYTASGCSEVSGRTEITQSHANCICNKISAATVGNLSCSSGNGITIGTYQVTNDCPPSEASVSTTATFIKNIGLSYEGDDFGSGNITGDIISNYCSSSSRSGYVTIAYQLDNGSNCTTSFLATQDAGTSVTLTPASTIPSTGGNVTLAEYSFTGEQPNTVTANVNDRSFISGVGITSDNKISGTVKCNYCNSNSRTNVVTLTYGNGTCSCTEECFITQKGGATITLIPSGIVPSSGGSVTLAAYTIIGEEEVNGISASTDNTEMIPSISVDKTNKRITGTVSYNCNNQRSANITLTYGNSPCSCTTSCTVVQEVGVVATLWAVEDYIPCSGGTNITLAKYDFPFGNEPSNVTASTNCSDFISDVIVDKTNKRITSNVSGNCCFDDRNCDLILTYGECEKKCQISQKGGLGDKEIICTDSGYTQSIDCSETQINTTSGGTLYLKLKNK